MTEPDKLKEVTPVEMRGNGEILKERAKADASLVNNGGYYVMEDGRRTRLEVSMGQILEIRQEMESQLGQRERQKIEKEVALEYGGKTIAEIIQAFPGLAAKLEVIPLEREGDEIVLFRRKDRPDVAMAVWSKVKPKNKGGVTLTVPEDRLSTRVMETRFPAVCVCCSPERNGLESPFRLSYPKDLEFKRLESESDADFEERKREGDRGLDRERKKWHHSEEARKDEDWERANVAKFIRAIEGACFRNGIRVLAMRYASDWDLKYNPNLAINIVEATDSHVKLMMRNPEPESTPGFKIL